MSFYEKIDYTYEEKVVILHEFLTQQNYDNVSINPKPERIRLLESIIV